MPVGTGTSLFFSFSFHFLPFPELQGLKIDIDPKPQGAREAGVREGHAVPAPGRSALLCHPRATGRLRSAGSTQVPDPDGLPQSSRPGRTGPVWD